MKSKIFGGIITIILALFMFLVNLDNHVVGDPIEAYEVYLNGENLGMIASQDELYDLIDSEQTAIKDKYNVDKVYPPNGLDDEKIYTYNNDITDVKSIYEKIKDIEPFTVSGYRVTITYTEENVKNDVESEGIHEPVYLYMLDKSLIKDALYNTALAFIDESDLTNYENGTQEEITDTGSIITSVYFEETITIREDLVDSEEYIFTNVEDLSRYLLYGTLEDQESYTVRDGDDLEKIANNHSMNVQELLIANPNYSSADILLSAGEIVNVGLINPLVNVVYRKTVVEDQEVQYKTEYVDDSTKSYGLSEVTTQGQNGINRITQDVKYVNGEVNSLVINKTETIKEAVNEVISRGTLTWDGGYYFYENTAGNDTWSWPTISPFIITSRYKWRWGRQHQGIDISGTGYASPIYAVGDGVVSGVNYDASKAEGISVTIYHGNVNGIETYTIYMHCAKILVTLGQTVSKEQKIALMGSTGSSTGTHLHLGVSLYGPPGLGTYVDPCASIFTC